MEGAEDARARNTEGYRQARWRFARDGVARACATILLAAQSTRERVQSSIDSLGYVYDRAAANLRARHTYTVGLVVCEITNPFYAELTAGIDEALDHAGWVGFLANTAESPARQDRFIERMREHRVDGLLLCPAEGTDPETHRTAASFRRAGGSGSAPAGSARQ